MNIYLRNLVEQFKQATGNKDFDFNFECLEENSEFVEWVLKNNEIAEYYRKFLEYMDVNPEIGSTTAEVGKGFLDSIAIDSPMSIITPYSKGITKPEGMLLVSDFKVRGNDIVLVKDSEEKIVTDVNFERFITQNPYGLPCVKGWENLHNSDSANITIGMYGSINDKDYQAKIEFLKSFKEKLYEGYMFDFTTVGDSYFYVISSNRLIRKKVLTRDFEVVKKRSESLTEETYYYNEDRHTRGR